MASSYSDLGLELMVTGENAGTWGDKTNSNLNLIQQAVAGYEEVSIAGGAQTTALAVTDATLSNGRNQIIKFTGTITGNQIVTIPDSIEKTYTLINGTSGAFTVQFKTVSGSGFTFSTTEKNAVLVYSNGTDVVEISNQLAGQVVGTDIQAYDADLTAIGALATTDSNFIVGNGSTWVAESGATARTSLGVGTGNDVQFDSFGVGTAASGTTGEIRATNNITAYYSDDRLKTKLGNIDNALEKICSLNGFYYQANQTAVDLGYEVKKEVGVSAQEVQKILPEIIAPAPIDSKYMTVYYDKLIPLLIEAIKELQNKVDSLIKKGD